MKRHSHKFLITTESDLCVIDCSGQKAVSSRVASYSNILHHHQSIDINRDDDIVLFRADTLIALSDLKTSRRVMTIDVSWYLTLFGIVS